MEPRSVVLMIGSLSFAAPRVNPRDPPADPRQI